MKLEKFGPDGLYYTRPLGPPDMRAMQQLFERCSDYFTVATGAPAQPDEASRALVAGPPTKSVDDKRVIGVFRDEALVGLIDAITDWPEAGVWSIGMFLLDPAHRHAGLGRQLATAFEDWSRQSGATSYRTAIVTRHADGIRFLERCGYAPDTTLDGYNAGAQVTSIRFYTKGA